ncbi:MFS transporter [Chromobacterium vaccinii]|uniref:MFS transporter n=1 Tax=Chromobacterium vaccinii TaxID=1108595 RepID=A0ABV0FJL4_9NEIS
MSNPYLQLFQAPGTRGFALAGLIARMPISMTGIGIITMLSQLRGSYGLAGAVAATFAFCCAIMAPQVSRLVDKHGQGKILPPAAAISVAGMAALLICVWQDAPDWSLFACAVLAGFMPSMPAMVRARWTEVYRGQPLLQTAYALETVLDEVCFIIGPPISVGLSVALFPQAGPLVAMLLLAVGVAAFILQKGSEPPIHAATHHENNSVIRYAEVRILTLLLIAMGVIVGTVDVVSVAFAQNQGMPAAASIVLSVYAIGSCAAGLLFGAFKISTPLQRLFLYCGAATALATLPMLLAWNIATLAVAVGIAGLFFAPSMIVAMGLVESAVPSAKLTEGLTWLITGLGIGVSIGAAASGWVVDIAGTRAGFLVALAAGAAVLLISLYGYGVLRRRQTPVPALSA